jgi:metallo-beta-lactamase family protein
MEIMLLDSAKLQQEEAEYAQRKGYSRHSNPLALYGEDDAGLLLHCLRKWIMMCDSKFMSVLK